MHISTDNLSLNGSDYPNNLVKFNKINKNKWNRVLSAIKLTQDAAAGERGNPAIIEPLAKLPFVTLIIESAKAALNGWYTSATSLSAIPPI